jgi:hypothetical protein
MKTNVKYQNLTSTPPAGFSFQTETPYFSRFQRDEHLDINVKDIKINGCSLETATSE